MATEIALLPLKKGMSEDPNGPGGQAWKDAVNILIQQKGIQRAFWGTGVETPDMMRLFVDWDNTEGHKLFIASEQYGTFLERLNTILDDPPSLYHAYLSPYPAVGARAPATEILTLFFPPSYSEAEQKKFEEDMTKFLGTLGENAKEYRGSSGGWSVDEVTIPGTSEKAKAYVTLIGWSSVEAHSAYREGQAFKDNIHYLREAKDLKKMTMVHAHLKEIHPGESI